MLKHRRVALSATMGLMAMAFVATTLAATTVVRPSAMGSWAFQVESTASAGMVTGPATPPLGSGSAQLSVGSDGDGAAQLRNSGYAGTALADLTKLDYWTFVQVDGSGDQAPYLILNLDLDGNGSVDDLLFFEPVYQSAVFFPSNPQGPLVDGTWQTWDALNGGWWSVSGVAGAGPGTDVKSIDDYLAVEGDATIVNSSSGGGGVRIVAGFGAPSWNNFVGHADAFTIGVNGNNTTFDFEPNLPQPANKNACKGGGWANYARADGSSFKNQGDCIQYANTGK